MASSLQGELPRLKSICGYAKLDPGRKSESFVYPTSFGLLGLLSWHKLRNFRDCTVHNRRGLTTGRRGGGANGKQFRDCTIGTSRGLTTGRGGGGANAKKMWKKITTVS